MYYRLPAVFVFFRSGYRLNSLSMVIAFSQRRLAALGYLSCLKGNKIIDISAYPMTDLPPIYGRSTSGILTVPSALRLFSKNAISIRGGATTVLLSV